jgi:PAS domain S-box-containing protein
MKLKYEINLAFLAILIAVASSIAIAGVMAISRVTHDLNLKIMKSEVQNLLADIGSAHEVLKASGVSGVHSYVERAQADLIQEFRGYSFGKTGRLMILERPNRVVWHEGLSPGQPIDFDGLRTMIGEESGSLECLYDKQRRIFSYAGYPEWNWWVALTVTTDEVLEARNRFLLIVVVILVSSLIAGTALFLSFTSRLVKPIRQLAQAATHVSRGEWDAPLPVVRGTGEIAQLSEAFRSMSENLAGSYRNLQETIEQIAYSEEQLRKSKERFRALVETTSDWVWEVDEKGAYTYVSPGVTNLLGYRPEEILGKTPFGLMPPEEAERTPSNFSETLESVRSFTAIENTVCHKDGRMVVLESSGIPYFDDEGVFRGYRGIDRDITERKRSEDAFKNLIIKAPIGIFIVQKGVFKLVNPGVEEITGFEKEFLVGKDALGWVLPEHREMVRIKAVQMVKGLHNTPFEFQIVTRNGETRWVMETVTPTQYRGRKATLGYFVNITERKLLEDELFQSQKMQAIGRLAGGVAHDFNNLLTAVLGYSELVLNRIDPGDRLRGDIEQIKKAGERAASLTRQLLAFSRKQVLQPKFLDLNVVVVDMEQMLQRLIGEDIELVSILDPALKRVFADPSQIEQVIMNLAVNGRDAMPEGGKLTIETRNVYIGEFYTSRHTEIEPGSYILLAVSDTGRGMDQDTRAHIFEPFYTTKEEGKGTGLGLATVYGIIKQSNGHVTVYSERDRGSAFMIYLPVAQGPDESANAPLSAVDIPGGSETILLVEDDKLVRGLALEILTRAGYRVLEASNGREALQICREWDGRLHMVITDVVMPGMSGRELADEMVFLHPDVKVLFMSGYTENAIVHHGVLQLGLAFLQKPFTPAVLARKVRQVLDSDTVMHEGEASSHSR